MAQILHKRATTTHAIRAEIQRSTESAIEPIVAEAGPNDTEAQARAKEILSGLRFDGSNYVFVYDYQGTTLVQPVKPESIGKNAIETKDKHGNLLIRDMITLASRAAVITSTPGRIRPAARSKPSIPMLPASTRGAGCWAPGPT
ncbi:hypothetical protein GCM10007159_42620 [Modicisalibacter luteus]|nr:hypothetical protein GCM10007159_42620 [Halomonas lutea]